MHTQYPLLDIIPEMEEAEIVFDEQYTRLRELWLLPPVYRKSERTNRSWTIRAEDNGLFTMEIRIDFSQFYDMEGFGRVIHQVLAQWHEAMKATRHELVPDWSINLFNYNQQPMSNDPGPPEVDALYGGDLSLLHQERDVREMARLAIGISRLEEDLLEKFFFPLEVGQEE